MQFALILALLFQINAAQSQTAKLPSWFNETFKSKGLDKKYRIQSFLTPAALQADFNGDSKTDIAIQVIEKTSKKKGILIIHQITKAHFIFGAGTNFGNGGDNFRWADKWTKYTKKVAYETQTDEETGDLIGSKVIQLSRPGILIEHFEDGSAHSGGIIYWNGKKYTWIQQGE